MVMRGVGTTPLCVHCCAPSPPTSTPKTAISTTKQTFGKQHFSTEPPPPPGGTADPGVVKQDKSSRGSVGTTKRRSDPQRVCARARGQ